MTSSAAACTTNLEINLYQNERPADATETNRRLSWDDFSVFYQIADSLQYLIHDEQDRDEDDATLSPTSPSNKSQNPSPRLAVHRAWRQNLSVDLDAAAINLDHELQGTSETATDSETSSSSAHLNSNVPQANICKSGNRSNQMHKSVDDDEQSEEEQKYTDDDHNHSRNNNVEKLTSDSQDDDKIRQRANFVSGCDDDNDHEMDSVSLSLSDHLYADPEHDKLTEVKSKLNVMMERIEQLTRENQELETSKLSLAISTVQAMDHYRQVIKTLSAENQILRRQMKGMQRR